MKTCNCGNKHNNAENTCTRCQLGYSLSHFVGGNTKEEVGNMPKGSYEESKQMFFDKQTYKNYE